MKFLFKKIIILEFIFINFIFKGFDVPQRKIKTDRLKIERLNPPDLRRRYQTSDSVTILYNCDLDALYSSFPLDRNELIRLQAKSKQQFTTITDSIKSSSALTPSSSTTFYINNSSPSSFCYENEMPIQNNPIVNETLQYYVENTTFGFNESSSSKFGLIKDLIVDDMTTIIDEAPESSLTPLNRRNSLTILTTKTKVEPENIKQNQCSNHFSALLTNTNNLNKPILTASASLPHDLSMLGSNKMSLINQQISMMPTDITTTTTTTTKQLYSSQTTVPIRNNSTSSVEIPKKTTTISTATSRLNIHSAIKVSPNLPLKNYGSSKYVHQWLLTNRFTHLLPIFKNYTSNDFLRLSKDDLIKLCGAPDAIRCYNLAHSIQVCPRLTVFVKFNEYNYFYAIYLNDCKCKSLIKRILQVYHEQKQKQNQHQNNIMIINDEPVSQDHNSCSESVISSQCNIENYELYLKFKGALIKTTDEVLSNIHNDTKFIVQFVSQLEIMNNNYSFQNNNNNNRMFENDHDLQAKSNNQIIIMIPLD